MESQNSMEYGNLKIKLNIKIYIIHVSKSNPNLCLNIQLTFIMFLSTQALKYLWLFITYWIICKHLIQNTQYQKNNAFVTYVSKLYVVMPYGLHSDHNSVLLHDYKPYMQKSIFFSKIPRICIKYITSHAHYPKENTIKYNADPY